MNVEVNLNKLIRNNLTPNQFVLLVLLYYKEYDQIKKLFGIEKALAIRNGLVSSKYILNGKEEKFRQTIISKANVGKILGIRSDKINFWEFYNSYPIRYGSRVLRAKDPDSKLAKKHEAKYCLRVKTQGAHEEAVASIQAYVDKQRLVSKLQYLPAMETVLNNSLWEQWTVFIETVGTEGANWNTTTI